MDQSPLISHRNANADDLIAYTYIITHDKYMSKSKRGFARMSQSERSAIAKAGGIPAYNKGTAHTYSYN